MIDTIAMIVGGIFMFLLVCFLIEGIMEILTRPDENENWEEKEP